MVVPDNAMYFIWQGKASKDYGLVMTSVPSIIFPQKKVTETYASNAVAPFVQYDGYEPFDISFDVAYLHNDGDTEMRKKIIQFLYSTMVYFNQHMLIFQNDKQHYYYADIISQINWAKFYQYRTTTLTFHCRPYTGLTNYAAGVLDPQITEFYWQTDNIVVKTSNSWHEAATINRYRKDVPEQTQFNRNPRLIITYKKDKQLGNAHYLTVSLYHHNPDNSYLNPNLRVCDARNIIIDLSYIVSNWLTGVADINFELDFRENKYIAYRYVDNEFQKIDISRYINSESTIITPKDELIITDDTGMTTVYSNVSYNPSYALTFGPLQDEQSGNFDIVCDIGLLSSSNTWVGDNSTFQITYYPRVTIL